MSLAVQAASVAAWGDETHVQTNRALYEEKFSAVLDILSPVLPVSRPTAGFYLWLQTAIPDEVFAHELFVQQNIIVLPGSFLSRVAHGKNPGQNRVRVALVPPLEICISAAWRIRALIEEIM
jgi:N-succinyldiaminopimelate aminotransferase